MDKNSRIYVAGHRGMVGAAISRRLRADGFETIIERTHAELDLTDQAAVRAFFAENRPSHVFLAAAKVGGIYANDTYPADFILGNLQIQTNVLESAWRCGAEKVLFLGSACIYPRDTAQPIREDSLLTDPLEPTNEWYAIAKISGVKTCQALRKQHGFDAISAMPTNLYGIGDNFHLDNAHVLPALMHRFHLAKEQDLPEVVVWGTGTPRREFLHVDDLADACMFLMREYSAPEVVNVGIGEDISIAEIAEKVKEIVGYRGELVFDRSKPDGTPRRLLDVSRLGDLGWTARIGLEEGLRSTYQWFLDNRDGLRS